MEEVEGALDGLSGAWAGIPALPDLGLPAPADPLLLVAIATIVSAFGLLGLVTGWVERRLSVAALFAALLGAALFFWVWETDRAAFDWLIVPEAFIELVARILR
ncbi:hypothetical protein [Jannaschia marina]|uniref:hypothetical protein n=1 Tax=Jannaschia marina TaxID=2741674 RepID=UPI0015CBDFEF|nr:hypothetical protein [Jannaschia marina]